MKSIFKSLFIALILLAFSASSISALDANKYSCGWDSTRTPPCFVADSACDSTHTPGSCELIPNDAVCEPSRIRDCLNTAPPPPVNPCDEVNESCCFYPPNSYDCDRSQDPNLVCGANNICISNQICTTKVQCTSASECVNDGADGVIDCFIGCNIQGGGGWGCTTPPEPSPLCGPDNLGVDTAIGCLMAGDPKVFIGQILGWSIGIGSGIAFLIILYAAFQITTAAGNPKQIQAAQELLTSAIMGLILIVTSIVLLNLIGFTILKLPGFNL